jgi:nucleotide-binding universal stress UspA family protein
MMSARGWSVLVATDGTPEARAAVAAAAIFPWPPGTRVSGVIARRTLATIGRPQYFVAAFDRMFRRIAANARRALAARWPDAEVRVVDATPVDGILAEARRAGADVIVMGSRARGRLPRLLLGSVARQVVRRASCATLVVRGRPREFSRFTIGLDGSAGSRQAVDLVAALRVPRGGRVTLVAVVEPLRPPSLPLVPASVREVVVAEVVAENARRVAEAKRHLTTAARSLERVGWTVRTTVGEGQPLAELLAAAAQAETQVLVVGARGAGGVERLLLGSVAEGVLNRAALPVLLAGRGGTAE